MEILECLKGKVIVSVQAMPYEPLYKEDCINALIESVLNGGAAGLRVAGKRDTVNAKKCSVPVIGITKPDKLPDNWQEVVYITPTVKDATDIINAGADIIAFDGTLRPRPDGSSVNDIISAIHNAKRIAMADISTYEEGMRCIESGADVISTTLAGYTTESLNSSTDEPAYELLSQLVNNTKIPVILEGRIWEPEQVKNAFDIGAYSVVIGSAITRPQLITKRFINYKGTV